MTDSAFLSISLFIYYYISWFYYFFLVFCVACRLEFFFFFFSLIGFVVDWKRLGIHPVFLLRCGGGT